MEFRERGPQLTRSARALKLYLSPGLFGLERVQGGDRPGGLRWPSTRRPCWERDERWRILSRPPRSRWCVSMRPPPRRRTDGLAGASERSQMAMPRRVRPCWTGEPSRGCARLTCVPPKPRHRGHDRAARAVLRLKGSGGAGAPPAPPAPGAAHTAEELVWSGPSGRSAGVALRGVREGCRPLGQAHRKPVTCPCARSLNRHLILDSQASRKSSQRQWELAR